MHPAFFMSAKSARNCRKAFRWAHIKKSWASGAPKTPTENPAQPPLLRGGCAGGALLFRCGFPVCPHVCRGRVEVNLQRITDRASVLFSVRVVGLWFIHTFQRPRIPITADYCPHMLPHVRFPCQEPHPLRAGGACVCWVLPLALGAGCWVLGAGCWVLGAGAGGWLYPTHCVRAYAAPAGALHMSPAQAHKPRVVGSCDSQLVVLRFTRNPAE